MPIRKKGRKKVYDSNLHILHNYITKYGIKNKEIKKKSKVALAFQGKAMRKLISKWYIMR